MSAAEPHIIRLRGPWEYTLLSGPRAGESGRIDLGAAGPQPLLADAGAVRLTRHFNAPTGITASRRVQLIVRNFPHDTVISLDGAPLTPGAGGSCDLTGRLNRRHRLDLDLPGVTELGEVWLEIRD